MSNLSSLEVDYIKEKQINEDIHTENVAEINHDLKTNENHIIESILNIEERTGEVIPPEELASIFTLVSEPVTYDSNTGSNTSVENIDTIKNSEITNSTNSTEKPNSTKKPKKTTKKSYGKYYK